MTEIQCRPALFNDAMVRAILNKSKTQTRQPMVPQPDDNLFACNWYHPTRIDRHGEEGPGSLVYGCCTDEDGWVSPFGGPKNRLWVRECWQQTRRRKSDGQLFCLRVPTKGCGDLHYRADNELDPPPAWHPSIHMPHWASRITLDVNRVWAERVQDISEDDAIAEGWSSTTELFPSVNPGYKACRWFCKLWGSIYSKPKPISPRNPLARTLMGTGLNGVTSKIACYVSYPWDEGTQVCEHRGRPWYVFGNPWVFGAEFKMIKEQADGWRVATVRGTFRRIKA